MVGYLYTLNLDCLKNFFHDANALWQMLCFHEQYQLRIGPLHACLIWNFRNSLAMAQSETLKIVLSHNASVHFPYPEEAAALILERGQSSNKSLIASCLNV